MVELLDEVPLGSEVARAARQFTTSLYPIARMKDGGAEWIYRLAAINPFTHAIEALRAAFYGQLASLSLAVVVLATVVFYLIAAAGYDPQRGLVKSARPG